MWIHTHTAKISFSLCVIHLASVDLFFRLLEKQNFHSPAATFPKLPILKTKQATQKR